MIDFLLITLFLFALGILMSIMARLILDILK